MKSKNPILISLIIISIVINVMPFNILSADEYELNYGKAALTQGNTIEVRTDSNGNNVGYTATSGNLYVYGRYNQYYTPILNFYSNESFTISPSEGTVQYVGVNNTMYYTSEYTSSTGNYSPNYMNPAFPQISSDSLNVPNRGDYVFDFLGPEAFLGTTHYNAEQSFLSWTVGNNPYTITCSSDCYVVGAANGSATNLNSTSYSDFKVYIFVENAQSTIEISRASGSLSPTLNHTEYRGIDIYYYLITSWSYNPSSYTYNWNTNIIRDKGNVVTNALHMAYNIYLYDTYEEPDPMVYGDIKDLGYYSKFVNNQQSSSYVQRMTKDVITWNPSIDNIGNRIDNGDYQVQIQAVGIEYSELSYNSLMSLDMNDMLALGEPVDIATVDVRNGKLELTWGDVIDALSDQNIVLITSSIFAPVYQNDYWIKQGWYYKVRLINESEDYYGNWQTVYQLTAFDPQPSQNVIDYYVNDNNTYPNQDVEQIINNINVTNNTTNNWYTNETPIGYNGTNKPWYEVLLEKIVDLIGLITSLIGGMFDSLVKAIEELVSNLGINLLETFTNIINNVVDLFGDIDLTGNDYVVPNEYTQNINTFNLWTTGIFNAIFNSGLGLLILIPLILLIVGLVL